MSNESISRLLARHIVFNRQLSPEIRQRMQLLLLDYYAVTAGGAQRDSAAAARSAVTWATGPVDPRTSELHGLASWATAEDAALVNGITAHGLELDDTHEEGSLHPAVAVFPAALALADANRCSAGAVLVAAAIGYDIMCSVGVLLGASESYGRGFHPTGVAGAVGAAAAVSSLLALDENKTVNALGLAANMASGSLEFLSDGSWTKRLNAGQAAANGLRAARLAAAGFTAPERAFEGRDGFLRQYGAGEVPGRRLELTLGQGAAETSIKFYPCCRYMHGNIDLLREIHKELGPLQSGAVASVDLAVIGAGAALVSEPAERKLLVHTTVDAQFSMPFGAAVALTTGEATVAQFDDAPVLAQNVRPLMDKVTCYTSDELEAAYPARWKAEVTVQLTDGRTIRKTADSFKGSLHKPATYEDVAHKAAGLVGAVAAEELAHSILHLDLDLPIGGQVKIPVLPQTS